MYSVDAHARSARDHSVWRVPPSVSLAVKERDREPVRPASLITGRALIPAKSSLPLKTSAKKTNSAAPFARAGPPLPLARSRRGVEEEERRDLTPTNSLLLYR